MKTKIKQKLFLCITIVLMMMCFVFSVNAETDGIFEYSVEDGKAIITGYVGSEEELIIPSTIADYDVVGIGWHAFNEVDSAKKIVIEEGITYIDEEAFLRIGAKEIILPDTITEIGSSAFAFSRTLNKITFSQNLQTIGEEAFNGCDGLQEAVLPDSLTELGAGAFSATGIKKIRLSNSLETIPVNAFRLCLDLKEIVIPESVKKIEAMAFEACYKLRSISLSGNITEIGANAFGNCRKLEQIILPESLITIGKSAFNVCNSLTEIIIPSQIEVISESAFEDCVSLVKVVLPNNVRKIEYRAFSNCKKLEYFDFNKVEEIGEEAFVNCESLKHVVFGDGIKKIGNKAFSLKLNMEPIYVCYEGNESQWLKISGVNKYAPMNAGVHFSYSDEHLTEEVVTKANISNNGSIEKKCKACDYSYVVEHIYKPYNFSISKKSYTYDGKVKTPEVYIENLDMSKLVEGTDYQLTYESGRKNPGKYTVTVTFKGNYEGKKTLYFSILPGKTSNITATQSTDSIKLTWKKVTGATGYRVYQYNSKTGKYEKIKTLTGTSYTVKKLKAGTSYKFAVKAYSKSDGETLWASSYKTITTATKPATPTVKATAGSKQATISWKKVTGATGYVVYMQDEFGDYEKIGTTKNTSYTRKKLTKGETYYFRVRAYKTVDGKNIYGGYKTVKVKVK